MQDTDLKLDGNAVAGLLDEIFGRDMEMTSAQGSCPHCGASHALGALMVYLSAIGTVMRCPGCDAALIRITSIRGRYCLDMTLQLAEA